MTRKRILNTLGKCAVLIMMVGMLSYTAVGYAQVVPGAADATRFPNDVEKRTAPPSGPIHPSTRVAEPVPPQAVPPDAAALSFVLREIQLSGVEAYHPAIFRPLWEGDIGKKISLKRIYEIAGAITAKYREDGYMLSRAFIPGQTIQDGVVRIQVVEGYVRQVRFEGDMPSSYLLNQARRNIMMDRPLKSDTLERQMLLLNDLPGTDFHAVLKTLPDIIGQRDLNDTRGGSVRQLPHILEAPVTVVKIANTSKKMGSVKEPWRKKVIRLGGKPRAPAGKQAATVSHKSAMKRAASASTPAIKKSVKKTEEKPVEKAATKTEEKPAEKVATKTEEKPIEKAATKPETKTAVKAVRKPAVKTAAKAVKKPVMKAAAKTVKKPVMKAAAKAVKKPVTKAAAKTVKKPAMKTAAGTAKKTAVKPAAKTTTKMAAKTAKKPAARRPAKHATKTAAKTHRMKHAKVRAAKAAPPAPAKIYTYPGDFHFGKTQPARESCHCDTALDITALVAAQNGGVKNPARSAADHGPDHGKVIFVASDDATADTVARDLVAAGAPLDRFHVVPSPRRAGPWDYIKRKSKLDHDLDAVRELIKNNKNAELIVLDPIEAYFGDLKHGAKNMREVVAPLARIAVQNHTPILIVSRAPPPLPGVPRIVIPPQQKPIVLPAEPFHDGGVMLVIHGTPRRAWQGQISIDNAESRFLGPWLVGFRFSLLREPIPYGRTDFAFNFTPGNDKLRFFQVAQTIPLTADGVDLTVQGSYTKGHPGFTLAPDKIESTTWTTDSLVSWTPMRRRMENLRLSAGISTIDAHTTALGFPLSEDHTRAIRLQGHFDEQDSYEGSSTVDLTLSKGLYFAGASNRNDPLLSRAGGRPDFLTLTGQAYRYQRLSSVWEAVLGVSGQAASSPLLSEQQWGYGGQAFGRAYDPSEIVGDQGLAGTVELRYDGFRKRGTPLQPFSFYDIGAVWNRSATQPPKESGASAGAGFRLDLPFNGNMSFLVAQPLTLRQADPQFGNGRSKRYVLTFTQPL